MTPEWLNENSFRNYPLLPTTGLWQDAIADMGVLLGPFCDWQVSGGKKIFSDYNRSSNFDPTLDVVYLASLQLIGPNLVFTFHLTSSFASGASLVFTCPSADPPFTTYHAQAVVGGVIIMEGFLTTGFRDNTLANIGGGYTGSTLDALEPAAIQDLSGRYVDSVSVANYPRVKTTPSPGCGSSSIAMGPSNVPTSLLDDEIVVNAINIQGDIKFREGFNVAIRQESGSNSIVISGAVGGGAGLVCGEVPLNSIEHETVGSLPLTGGPLCSQVLQTINGISGTNIRISAGQGFHIQEDTTQPNTLIISAKATDFAVCLQ